ncbi:MAG: hypothetical protein JXA10_08550 [Anaerolineae bacterium]|nr:hypothetical protein [Anaerolineae bacterium]
MGVTGSLIISDIETVAAVNPLNMPAADTVITKVLDAVTMTHLHVIIMGGTYEDTAEHYLENPVFMLEPEEEWLWVYAVPDDLVARFAQLTDEELANAVQAFQRVEEVRQWYVSVTWMRQFFTDVRALCARAIASEQQVFLYCML